ncbi:MAG: aldo/keto reductase [Chloroflexaceae bacterium]|jgi:aryl-alcohol dehydrogenase-like predicted oxidoreductase|nr:aldo/keto reductase [Chloroflexaceae bacterium]
MTLTRETIMLGSTNLHTAPLGVGAWSWGDSGFWGYGKGYGQHDVAEAFVASTNSGITFFDTAEVYGNGTSERILGELVRKSRSPVLIASKFAPLPWRLSPRSLRGALDASLKRLGVSQIALYQIHWPYTLLPLEGLMEALADAVAEGKVQAVGVSNYSAEQMQRAHAVLARRGVPLASNQVHYSLLKRTPEVNGVLDTCRQLNVTLIAYSPLAQGLLTGKYNAGQKPEGVRRFTQPFAESNLRAIEPVITLLREIGEGHGGKSPGQVALNWLICQEGVLPIPGAKNARQASSNAGALGWALTAAEQQALGEATSAWCK